MIKMGKISKEEMDDLLELKYEMEADELILRDEILKELGLKTAVNTKTSKL